jgi:hemerythrin-like domain-containing protein
VALISLSHEHHKALSVARQLRRVTPESADSVREATLGFWLQHQAAHLRAEEELLLPAYAKHGDPRHPLVAAVLCDHVDIRWRMNALSEDDCVALTALVELGALLAEHVRLEERRLFPLIEASVPDEDLANLAATLRDQA